jgi:DNA-binding NarL/FixJ family response regulator
VVLPPDLTAQVVAEMKRVKEAETSEPEPDFHMQGNLPEELTDREIEVLKQLGFGLSNREIAERLVITEGTVKNHVSNIITKLGLRDRTQAAIYAVRHGIARFDT